MGIDLSQLRNQFSIYVIDSDVSAGSSTVDSLKSVGYADIHFYPTLEAALSQAGMVPPHIILFEYDAFQANAEKFMLDIKSISDEIVIIPAGTAVTTLPVLQLVSRRLAYDYLIRPLVSTLELVQKVDRAIGSLYFQFESEQLREGASASEPNPTNTPNAESHLLEDVHKALSSSGGIADFNQFLAGLIDVKDLDQTIQYFIDRMGAALSSTPVIYFKYMAGHASLLISHAAWLPLEKFRGIGVNLRSESPAALLEKLSDPMQIGDLRTLVKEVFRCENYIAFPHKSDGEVVGVCVVLSDDDVNSTAHLALAYRRSFELAWKRNSALKEKHALDTADTLTGLTNRKHFSQRLDEEISRARRLTMPLSMILLDIDGIHQWNASLGFQQADALIKSVAAILKKTARLTDIVARTGPDEFSILLPHTGYKGAAIKAEKLRRIIEATRIPILKHDQKLTVSFGVSEYPSLSSDAEALFRSCDEALMQVRAAGGNRVCLATAPADFKMDFVPRDPDAEPKDAK
jgi:diguanylate cyclase (GGDEF)-like protein